MGRILKACVIGLSNTRREAGHSSKVGGGGLSANQAVASTHQTGGSCLSAANLLRARLV